MLSAKEIAKLIGCSKQSILRRLKSAGISIRSREEVARLTQKYFRKPFDGDVGERLYYQGYRTGDLYKLRLTEFSIYITLSTTVPASIELFRELFSKYGEVKIYSQRDYLTGGYEWHLRVFLERPSFDFLVDKVKRLPEEAKGENFYQFLAGFSDAEGSIYVTHALDERTGKDRIRYRFKINNQDKELLEDITRVLLGDGLHPLLDLKDKKGKTRSYSYIEINTNRDIYELSLNRNDEVIQLLQRLHIRHEHKKREKQLLLRLWQEGFQDYRQIKSQVLEFRRNIMKENIDCTERAKQYYEQHHKKNIHSPPPFSQPINFIHTRKEVEDVNSKMNALQDEIKRILEEATGLKYRVRYHPDLDDPKWDVLLEKQLALIMPLYESYEAILAISGYSNGDIVIEPKITNSLKQLVQKLDHQEYVDPLIADRTEWSEGERLAPRTIKFLVGMERLAQEVNGDYDSDIELYIDEEGEEWQLQARFNSKNLSYEEISQKIERNIKALLKALKEYHKRMETIEK
jgi:hypothetical protein